MKTAACWRCDNSSSTGIELFIDGVELNFSDGNIQLNRAFGNAGPLLTIVVVVDVVVDVVVVSADNDEAIDIEKFARVTVWTI